MILAYWPKNGINGTVFRIRDVVSRFVCSLCPQLPFDMIESQLGSVVDDIMQTHLHEPIPDSHSFPYSHFCNDLKDVLLTELHFFVLINELNDIQ